MAAMMQEEWYDNINFVFTRRIWLPVIKYLDFLVCNTKDNADVTVL